jgi:ABC-type bacteriocin/lantibiotic exporter with double-glycine peptidase domain
MIDWQTSLIALCGLVFILLLSILKEKFDYMMSKKEATYNEKRTAIVGEIVVGASTMKVYGWEQAFYSLVQKFRIKQYGIILI